MKRLFATSGLLTTVLILSLLFSLTSCDKEKVEERPDLPPVESLIMDFSDFQTQPGSVKGLDAKAVVSTYTNFINAYTNVSFWNAFTTGSLIVPISSYAYALQQEPEYVGNKTWEWSYDFNILQLDYTATLVGKRLDNETFSMKMKIALSSLPAVSFTYFDGVCRYDHTGASWNLYKNDNGNSVKVLEVEWTKDYVTEDAMMKYTYVEPGMNETGSYIMWNYDADAVYDASYTISLSTGMVNIEWDMASKAGRIKNPVYFEDTNWHCWNSLLEDVDCMPLD